MTNCAPQNPTSVESLFHWNHKPEDRTKTRCGDRLEDIVVKHADPASITDFFVSLISTYFSDPNNIESDSLRELICNKDILVSAMSNFDTDKAGAKPAIYVEYGGKKNQPDFAKNNLFDYNSENGSKMYYTRWQLGFTFFVLGNTLRETLLLTEEVCKLCHCYQQPIQEAMGWINFSVAEVQKVQCISEDGSQDGFISSISVIIVAGYNWHLFESLPKLKRVKMHVNNSNSSLDDF